jgi:trehalose-6-phosphate synthase
MSDGGSERIVVVSNRLPMTLRQPWHGWRAERSPGGLATALSADTVVRLLSRLRGTLAEAP